MSSLPPVVVVGLDCITGLQTVRILTARGVPVIAIARDKGHFYCRTRLCERIIEAETGTEALIPLLAAATAPVVVDPVRVATSGAPLGHVDGATMIRLLEQAALVTPNTDELSALMGGMQPGPWAVEHGLAILHTGGHGNGDTLHDVLWLPDGSHRTWSHPNRPWTLRPGRAPSAPEGVPVPRRSSPVSSRQPRSAGFR